MTFVFVSNYLTLHQTPFCNAMYRALGDRFAFVSTAPMSQERIDMGWQEQQVHPYEISIQDPEARRRIDEADIVMTGSAPDSLLTKRLREGRIVIRYSERILRKGRWRIVSPRGIRNMVTRHTVLRDKPVYLLCAGAYTAGDYNLYGAYRGKCFKWGYFPAAMHYSSEQLHAFKNHRRIELLWVGRFLRLKHSELAVLAAEYLTGKEYDFHLTMIGAGEEAERLTHMIASKNLGECVTVKSFMPPEQVRRHMEQANVFLFTSDHGEGWGAVLNEAMNSGCAVVASHAIGAAPFLIQDGHNGCLFRSGDTASLCAKVESLVSDPARALELGTAAYRTIMTVWNADTAAGRLLDFCAALLENKPLPVYADGPLSRSGFLSDHWYKG